MRIKSILFLLGCLFGVVFFVYREGYDKGFTTAISQMQNRHAERIDAEIKQANETVKHDEKVMDKFISTQTDFIKRVGMVSEPVRVDKMPCKAVTVVTKKEDKHEKNNVVRVVGIDDDELYELQRLTRAANAH